MPAAWQRLDTATAASYPAYKARRIWLRFVWHTAAAAPVRRVTIEAQGKPLYKVLDRLFENQPVQYAALNGQVVLKSERLRKPESAGILLEIPKIKPPVQASSLYPPQELKKEEMAALEHQKAHWAKVAALEQWRTRCLERPAEPIQAPPKEPACTDPFYGNIGLTFGAYNFNIVQALAPWDSWSSHRIRGLSWGIGLQMASHFSIFGGPSLNLVLLRRIGSDTGLAGSSLPPDSFWQGRSGSAHAKAWAGFALGIRI